MDNTLKKAELEALLFYYGEPVEIKKISKLLKLKEEEAVDIINELKSDYDLTNERGITLILKGSEAQLATKPNLAHIGEGVVKEEFKEQLTPATLETLAIVAYLGPVSRGTIDYVRGVNSSNTLRNMLVRGLVERKISETKANAYEYSASFDFLKHMGLTKIEELPEYQKYNNILNSFNGMEENKVEINAKQE